MKLHKSYSWLILTGIFCLLAACGSKSEKNVEEAREPMIKEVTDLPDAEIKIPATIVGDELADIPVIQATPVSTPSQSPSSDSGNTDPGLPDGSGNDSASTGGSGNDSASTDDSGNDSGVSAGGSGNDSDASSSDGSASAAPDGSGSTVDPSSPHGTLDDDNNITYELDGETRTKILNDLASSIEASIHTILEDKYYYPNISDIQVNSDCTEFTIYLTVDSPNIYESMLMLSFYTVGDRYQVYYGIPLENVKTTVVYINETTGAELARSDSTTVQ